ncbi:MAG: cytidylate kinase-like family protein [Nitrospirae bacterium]|nr:cytidylate kinase-like family protein [Nitrospirota bacterium]
MSVITISRAPYSMGKIIAEGVSGQLGYKCVGNEIFAMASKEFGIPETQLHRAIAHAPSFWGMLFVRRLKHISYLQAALVKFFLNDNIVYYGPAGHLLIQGVSHILKVCIQANIDDRVHLKAKTEDISKKEALRKLLKEDLDRKKWSRFIYKIEDSEKSLYDLVIDTGRTSIEDVVKNISSEALLNRYWRTTYSVNCLKNIALAYSVKASLLDVDRDVNVRASIGNVFIHTRALQREREKRIAVVKKATQGIEGIENLEVIITEDIFAKYVETYR